MNGRRVFRLALAKCRHACFLANKWQPCTVELSLYNPREEPCEGLVSPFAVLEGKLCSSSFVRSLFAIGYALDQ